MTDIGTAVSLIVAISDLKSVQAIRRPVLANLIARGGIEGALGTVTMPYRRVPLQEREPGTQFLEQEAQNAATRLPAATAVRIESRIASVTPVPPVDRIDIIDCEPRTTAQPGPLAPPWRMPLPEEICVGPTVVKCPPPPPDVMNKGSLIDFFM